MNEFSMNYLHSSPVMCCGVVCIFLWNEKALFRKSFWKWFAMKRMCQSFQFIWREDQLNILDNVVIVKDLFSLFSNFMWRKIVSWKLFCQHWSEFLNQKSMYFKPFSALQYILQFTNASWFRHLFLCSYKYITQKSHHIGQFSNHFPLHDTYSYWSLLMYNDFKIYF